MKDVVEIFKKYTSEFDLKEKEIALKVNHSIGVMELMGELAFRLDLSEEEIKIARLIGLLHDVGRFPQWEKYKTFNDHESIDHAEIGADFLFKEGHIRDYIEDDKYDYIIEKAIRNHNKYTIEEGLDDKTLLFSKMIRDADKIDIYKQVAIKYENKFDAKEVTQEVLEMFKDEKCIKYGMGKTPSDKTINVLSFVFDINFNESFDLLVETDNFDLYLSMIDVSEDSEKLWLKLKELCFDKVNRGVGE